MNTLVQNECIFITYEDVIKTFKPYVLQLLATDEYEPYYKDVIDLNRIKGKTFKEVFSIFTASTEKNILKSLTNLPFDYDATYYDLVFNQHPEIIKNAELLSMGRSVPLLLTQSVLKKIYIHTDEYNELIYNDLIESYGNESNIVYIWGDIGEVIKKIEDKITMFVLNDVMLIEKLIRSEVINGSTVLFNSVAYNYKLDEKNRIAVKLDNLPELEKKFNFQSAVFEPDSKYK